MKHCNTFTTKLSLLMRHCGALIVILCSSEAFSKVEPLPEGEPPTIQDHASESSVHTEAPQGRVLSGTNQHVVYNDSIKRTYRLLAMNECQYVTDLSKSHLAFGSKTVAKEHPRVKDLINQWGESAFDNVYNEPLVNLQTCSGENYRKAIKNAVGEESLHSHGLTEYIKCEGEICTWRETNNATGQALNSAWAILIVETVTTHQGPNQTTETKRVNEHLIPLHNLQVSFNSDEAKGILLNMGKGQFIVNLGAREIASVTSTKICADNDFIKTLYTDFTVSDKGVINGAVCANKGTRYKFITKPLFDQQQKTQNPSLNAVFEKDFLPKYRKVLKDIKALEVATDAVFNDDGKRVNLPLTYFDLFANSQITGYLSVAEPLTTEYMGRMNEVGHTYKGFGDEAYSKQGGNRLPGSYAELSPSVDQGTWDDQVTSFNPYSDSSFTLSHAAYVLSALSAFSPRGIAVSPTLKNGVYNIYQPRLPGETPDEPKKMFRLTLRSHIWKNAEQRNVIEDLIRLYENTTLVQSSSNDFYQFVQASVSDYSISVQDSNITKSSKENIGKIPPKIFIVAPELTGTYKKSDGNGGFTPEIQQGASFAAPVVASVLGALMSYAKREFDFELDRHTLKAAVAFSANPSILPNHDTCKSTLNDHGNIGNVNSFITSLHHRKFCNLIGWGMLDVSELFQYTRAFLKYITTATQHESTFSFRGVSYPIPYNPKKFYGIEQDSIRRFRAPYSPDSRAEETVSIPAGNSKELLFALYKPVSSAHVTRIALNTLGIKFTIDNNDKHYTQENEMKAFGVEVTAQILKNDSPIEGGVAELLSPNIVTAKSSTAWQYLWSHGHYLTNIHTNGTYSVKYTITNHRQVPLKISKIQIQGSLYQTQGKEL